MPTSRTYHLENIGIDGRVTLKCGFKELYGGCGRVELDQDRNKGRALVKAVMTLGSIKFREFLAKLRSF